LQNDLGRHADAARSLDRYAELSPLMEEEVVKWLAARRADTAYLLGDFPAAATHAREVREDFYTRFASRLAESRGGEVVNSEVAPSNAVSAPEVSSPATPPPRHPAPFPPRLVPPVSLEFARTPPTVYDLLARFWKPPLPNPGPDATPPADALPDAAERLRVEQAGWRAVEFTLTPEAAFELIARGVPFLVTLVEAGFAQPRLAIGADRLKNTVSLADRLDRP